MKINKHKLLVIGLTIALINAFLHLINASKEDTDFFGKVAFVIMVLYFSMDN